MSIKQIKSKILGLEKELKNEKDIDVILLKWMQISSLEKELKNIQNKFEQLERN